MRQVYTLDTIIDAFRIMVSRKTDVMRVVGPAPMGGEYIELIMNEAPLRKAMLRYSGDILLLSLLISCITAALVLMAGKSIVPSVATVALTKTLLVAAIRSAKLVLDDK